METILKLLKSKVSEWQNIKMQKVVKGLEEIEHDIQQVFFAVFLGYSILRRFFSYQAGLYEECSIRTRGFVMVVKKLGYLVK